MNEELHPLVGKMKSIMEDILDNKKIEDLYEVKELQQLAQTSEFNSFIKKYTSTISLIDKRTGNLYFLLAKDQKDMQNKIQLVEDIEKFIVAGVGDIKL